MIVFFFCESEMDLHDQQLMHTTFVSFAPRLLTTTSTECEY